MSELSDQLESAMRTQEEADNELKHKWLHGTEIPGLREHADAMMKVHALNIRTGKHHFAGAAAWPNGNKAIEETLEFLTNRVVATMIQCCVNGVMVGKDPSKWEMDDWEEYWRSSVRADEAFDIAARFATDPDTAVLVGKYFAEVLAVVTRNLSFLEAEDPHKLKHVWDVWFQTFNTATIAFYISGVIIGRRWKEEEVLSQLKEVGME